MLAEEGASADDVLEVAVDLGNVYLFAGVGLLDIVGDREVAVVLHNGIVLDEACQIGDILSVGIEAEDTVLVLGAEAVLVAHFLKEFARIDKEDAAVALCRFFEHDDARGDTDTEKEVGWELDDSMHVVVGNKVVAYLLFRPAAIEDTGELDDGACSALGKLVEHVHGKSKVCLARRGKDSRGSIARVVDKERVLFAVPLDGIGRVGDDSIELFGDMHRRMERIAKADVEPVVVDVVKEHIDTAEVVGGGVDFLSEIAEVGIVVPDGFGKLHKQGTAAAGGVVYLLDVRVVVRGEARQEFADLLRRVELATRLACIACVHLHQILVGIAESINGVVLEIGAVQVHIANSQQHFAEQAVAHLNRVAELGVVHREIGEQAPHRLLAGRAYGTGFDGAEDTLESDIEVLVLLRSPADIAEELKFTLEVQQMLFLFSV